jgi:hypothetical protein
MRSTAPDCDPTQGRQSTTTRSTMTVFRQTLLNRLNGASATTITDAIHEPAFREAFGMVPVAGREVGVIDAWTKPGLRRRGRGYDCKTLLITDRTSRERLWPASLPADAVIMPRRVPAPTESVQIEFEHARISAGIRQLGQMFDQDPADAGSWLLGRLRERYDKGVAKRKVRQIYYAFLLRDLDGGLLAHTEEPMSLPLLSANSLDWHWQIVPDENAVADESSEPNGEPISLEGFDREGRLILRWYVRGGQVRERALLDPTQIVRFRV